MNVKSRRDENAAATRAALLRVARRLFADQGYAGTATEEIVRRARVTRGALYHHFRDKRDLFIAVLDEEHQKLASQAGAAAAAQPDPWSAIVASSNAFLDACVDRTVQQIVLIDALSVVGLEKQKTDEAYLANLKLLIRAAIAQGLLDDQPVDPLAHIIFGALHEAAMLIARGDDKQAARRSVSGAIGRLFDGLRGTSSGR